MLELEVCKGSYYSSQQSSCLAVTKISHLEGRHDDIQ